MIASDDLMLRLVRLKHPESWPTTEAKRLCFIFPTGGGGCYSCGSVSQGLSPGDVFIFTGSPGARLSPARTELVFWCFSLKLEHLLPLFFSTEISLLQNVLEGLKATRIYPASTPVGLECHRLITDVPAHFNLSHRGHLLKIAGAILAEEFKTAQQHRAGFLTADQHLVRVFESLSTDELLRLSVAELAEKFGCSRRHLNRLFHSHFGLSVGALRMEMRLLKAVSLLRDDGSKIITVAEHCGFNHLGLFNTCFKRRFGVSPGQWRAKMTANTPNDASIVVRLAAGVPVSPETSNPQIAPSEVETGGRDPSCPMRAIGLCPWNREDMGVPEPANGKLSYVGARKGFARSKLSAAIPNEVPMQKGI